MIKITCTKEEFALLIRACMVNQYDGKCASCLFRQQKSCLGIENIVDVKITEGVNSLGRRTMDKT